MSSTLPSSSSSVTASAPTASSFSEFSPYLPIWHGCIGIGILIFCLGCIIGWSMRRYRRELRLPLNDNPNGWPQNENVAASDWPETFDAQMGERASGGLNWEKSMPFSVTLLTDAESNRTSHTVQNGKASKNRGNSARESESEEQNARSPRLRAAVLVAMPSPLHARSHFGHAASGRLDELAIGLIEMPWIQEDHHSLKGNTS